MANKAFKLSRFNSGSVREVLHIAFPLILAALSANLMIFADRFILAQYSLTAMNAISIAASTISVLQFGLIAVASIAEIFVGQNNGAGLYQRLAEPTWQMIWLCLASFVIFIPVALYTGSLIIPEQYLALGLPFYIIITLFTPLTGMIAAISAFFTGQGKTKLVMYSTIMANIINLILDIILIFGIPGLVPALGTVGAAIATVVATLFQLILLFFIFLNTRHRHFFNTGDFHLNFSILWRCIRIGFPGAVGHMIELLAWSILLIMMARFDDTHITIVAIGINIYILFAFITDGLSKSITAISSNYIGANNLVMVKRVLQSGLISLGIVMGVIALPLLIFPHFIIDFFINNANDMLNRHTMEQLLLTALLGIWLFFVFDGIVWTIVGVLTAAGDTLFIMLVNSSTVWIFSILPIYILTRYYDMSAKWIWFVIALYSFLNSLIFYYRYKKIKWQNVKSKLAR